jgi:light-regulated signal transduction histidine kinase (bacteriophytochrome)
MKFGYASMAIVPIRDKDEVLGLIHLADKQTACFSPATVEFLESMSPLIGEAVRRFQAETELANYREHLEELVKQRTSELESANALLQTEIKERTRAEEAVRNVARELARSNQDLEQFAYVASHDLQEPLRAVAGYVGLLQRRYPEKVDARGQHYIESAMDGALRMQRLIEDLLAFSRVQTKGKTFAPANLGAALDRALLNLQVAMQETHAEVTSDPLPTLRVDASQISQLLQNLIGNGIKFHGEETPKIHIGAEQRDGAWTFSVRDNGIGMEPQYYDRIFQIFQRLHTRKQYPGTGIGLAICKKIVERHGGKIWVESQPGHGSTFYFTLPAK